MKIHDYGAWTAEIFWDTDMIIYHDGYIHPDHQAAEDPQKSYWYLYDGKRIAFLLSSDRVKIEKYYNHLVSYELFKKIAHTATTI